MGHLVPTLQLLVDAFRALAACVPLPLSAETRLLIARVVVGRVQWSL